MNTSSLRLPTLCASCGNGGTSAGYAEYRPYTRALLRRYFRMAVDLGRLPSILGGLCFRARVSSYPLHTFEDAVIFVHDIEQVFDRIDRHFMEIIAGVIMLDYSIPEAALRLGITAQRAERRYNSALDALSRVLLEAGLLRPLHPTAELADEAVLEAEPSPRKAPESDFGEALELNRMKASGRIQ